MMKNLTTSISYFMVLAFLFFEVSCVTLKTIDTRKNGEKANDVEIPTATPILNEISDISDVALDITSDNVLGMQGKLYSDSEHAFADFREIELGQSSSISQMNDSLYFLYKWDIYKYDDSGEKTIALEDSFESDDDFAISAMNNISGVIELEDHIYAIIYDENVERNGIEYLYDIENQSTYMPFLHLLYGTDYPDVIDEEDIRYGYYFCSEQYGDNIIVKKWDRQGYEPDEYYEYNYIDNTLKYLMEAYSVDGWQYVLSPDLAYNDDYLFLSMYEQNYHFPAQYEYGDSGKLFIINRTTYEISSVLDLKLISDELPRLINVDEENVYFFCPDEGAIKSISIFGDANDAGQVKTLVVINYETRFVDYDHEQNIVYFRINYGFTHRSNEGDDNQHTIEECILPEYRDSAELIYVAYDLNNNNYEIIERIKVNDLFDKVNCFGNLKEYLIDERIYLFNTEFSAYAEESFAYSFSIGD